MVGGPGNALCESWLREFVWPRFSRAMAREEIYLANHSLGRPIDKMADDVREATDLWYDAMDDAWGAWLTEMRDWREKVARLIGAKDGSHIVPKTSAGQALRAVLNAFPQARSVHVVTTRGEFDSIDFILKTYVAAGRAEVTWVEHSATEGRVPLYEVDSFLDDPALRQRPGLVVVSLVFFGTGQILRNVERLIARAHELGWLVLLDLYHAAGVIPLDFQELNADFGIGGSYKYLRGGPGACWLALARDRIGEIPTLDSGWFAKEDTFGYRRSDAPLFKAGGDGWLESTPPVLQPYQARSGLDFTLEIGVRELRSYSLAQQRSLREALAGHGLPVFCPADPEGYGAFTLLPHENPPEFCRRLKDLGVNADARGEYVRFGPDVLNSSEELARAAQAARAAY